MKENTIHLPQPSGPFSVGRSHFYFEDCSRKNPFPLTPGPFRVVPLLIWYPSEYKNYSNNDYPLSKYITDAVRDNLATIFPKITNLPKIITNSYENLPITSKGDKFQVILFNHGYCAHMAQNTVLMEHLASQGYITVSIGHPHEGIMNYPDGTSSPMDHPTFDKLMIDIQKNSKRGEEIENLLKQEDQSMDEVSQLTKELQTHGGYRLENIEIWVQDIRFIIDQLEKLHSGIISSQFKNKIDFSKGIGALGHSFGGNAAILACSRDIRITSAINCDGTMYGGFSSANQFNKPLLFMYNEDSWGINKYYYLINQNDTIQMQIRGAKHADFMDKTLFRLDIEGFRDIEGSLIINILNETVSNFFNEFLGKNQTDWRSLLDHAEVKFERKIFSS